MKKIKDINIPGKMGTFIKGNTKPTPITGTTTPKVGMGKSKKFQYTMKKVFGLGKYGKEEKGA